MKKLKDLASALLIVERAVDRKYLKHPLGNFSCPFVNKIREQITCCGDFRLCFLLLVKLLWDLG